MYSLLIASFVLFSVDASVLPVVPDFDNRIIGGSPALINEIPYQVALLVDRTGSGSYFQICSGSIISQTAILTAAQCTFGSVTSRWVIRAGSIFSNTGGITSTVYRIINHPSFNSQSFNNDIAIMLLNTKLNLSNGVQTITLPAQGLNVGDGSLAIISGWGSLVPGGSPASQLYKATIPTVNQQQCASAYSQNPVTVNMICAGRLGLGGVDACQGDAGGPLAISRILIGITSWGIGCADPRYPGVYTKVSMYRNWINSYNV